MCNAELGIFEPAVDDEEVVIGGRRSRDDEFYPYNGEIEVEFALKLIASAEVLSDASWRLWRSMVERMLVMERESRKGANDGKPSEMPYSSPRSPPRKNAMEPLPTPPSSNAKNISAIEADLPLSCSYNTLQDFYSLLDKIERTSPIGARFLEAYADRLHTEKCGSCWFASITVPDDEGDPPSPPLPSAQPLHVGTIPQRMYAPPRYDFVTPPLRPNSAFVRNPTRVRGRHDAG